LTLIHHTYPVTVTWITRINIDGHLMFGYHCCMHISMCLLCCKHWYYMYLYHRYTDILLHWTLWFHALVSSLYRYLVTLNTVISYSYLTGTKIHLSLWPDCSYIIVTWIFIEYWYLTVHISLLLTCCWHDSCCLIVLTIDIRCGELSATRSKV